MSVDSGSLLYEVTSLVKSRRYEFKISASTKVGEGETTKPATVNLTPNSKYSFIPQKVKLAQFLKNLSLVEILA